MCMPLKALRRLAGATLTIFPRPIGLLLASFALATFAISRVSAAPPVATAEPSDATEADPQSADLAGDELGREWVRIVKDDEGDPLAMQVAIVRYTGNAGGRPVEVDLVGAVHVGDESYYQALNRRFKQYDALLYELVAPEGTVIDPRNTTAGSRSPVGALQDGMKSMLELEHQLEKVDYQQPNFVHADMTPDQFFQSMEDRGEGIVQMFFRMMGQGIAMQSKQATKGESTDIDLMKALFAPDRARQLKIVFAEQMQDLEGALGGFGGEAGSTLITERNKAALAVLRRELAAGKSKLGIFYGAGHLPDMDERLRTEFGLLPESITWLDAWDLSAKN